MINYIPGVYSLLTNRWAMCIIVSMKEVHRIYGMHAGMVEAGNTYSEHYLVLFIATFIKGKYTVWYIKVSALYGTLK